MPARLQNSCLLPEQFHTMEAAFSHDNTAKKHRKLFCSGITGMM